MNAKRVAEIAIALLRAKRAGARLNGKSAIERELQAWIDEPEVPLPKLWEPSPNEDLP